MLELRDVNRAPSPSIHILPELRAQFGYAFRQALDEQRVSLHLRVCAKDFRVRTLERTYQLIRYELTCDELFHFGRDDQACEIRYELLIPRFVNRSRRRVLR